MRIILSTSAKETIYEQIENQIKEKILSNELQPGDNLPSIRALSKALHISVMTVQRAYENLQRDGFIKTTAGKGTYVSLINDDFLLEERMRQLEDKIKEAIEFAVRSDVDVEAFKKLVDIFYEGE